MTYYANLSTRIEEERKQFLDSLTADQCRMLQNLQGYRRDSLIVDVYMNSRACDFGDTDLEQFGPLTLEDQTMTETAKIIPTLSSKVQDYYSKHQALVAAHADLENLTGKAWSQGLRVTTRISNQQKALAETFSEADRVDLKALKAAMIQDATATR